ncbi:MAG: argininosuccinate lyase [Coriobacteriia bacterium]|nr:argininosuccinate lyase [Coriobacteriia bacterium]MCL2746911.1 argininosuccinate lyase [Coriobacteriia bacterium]MCL2870031.1 argininosuccinate lyase [Coriobacteriia bacterium]
MNHKKPAWSGRFSDIPSEELLAFGASLPIDKRMWRQDIAGSIAHAKMLARQGVLTQHEADAITSGLSQIAQQIEVGEFEWSLDDEDVHMAIERALTSLIGEDGARLHTGRSRNDQVATDTRLYMKERTLSIARALNALRLTLVELAERSIEITVPGYTHLQKAQPISLAHYYLAYSQMFARDFKRFLTAYEAADYSPLGSAALAGTSYPLDRDFTARELGFSKVTINALDAVSDRDFLLDAVYAASVCQVHLSRLSEELILWTTEEFGFLQLPDRYSTGSSIMPQKKNADFAELIRGKTGRVVGDLNALLVTLKGLPLAYNKDMQEDKEPAFDAMDTIEQCVKVMTGMIAGLTPNEERMEKASTGGFMAATDLADYLVEKCHLPFRQAYEIVGSVVLSCERQGRTLQDLSIDELQGFFAGFGRDVETALRIDKVVEARSTEGGTSPKAIAVQLEKTKQVYSLDEQRLALL